VSKKKIANSRAAGEASAIGAAAAALRAGDVIAFPTETLYGLGADALNPAAVEKVFQLKGRDARNPIPVLVSDCAMLSHLVTEIPPTAKRLMDRFWPGPLTLTLPARRDIPGALISSAGKIGVRVSSQAIATSLVKALGHPLTATSANPSGKEAARTVAEARNYFADLIQIFVDGGTLGSQTGSTVVDIIGDELRIIRAGDIAPEELANFVGSVKIIN
jgi:L-threonylcarbamoyladenylate synthase